MSNLLGRAGFTLLTVDVDEVKVNYPSMWELMEDLRDMGESNAVIGRSVICSRITNSRANTTSGGISSIAIPLLLLLRSIKVSHSMGWVDRRTQWCPYCSSTRKRRRDDPRYLPNNLSGMSINLVHAIIPTSLQIGWKPAPTQPKPLERGSAKTKLKDVL